MVEVFGKVVWYGCMKVVRLTVLSNFEREAVPKDSTF